MEFAGLEYDKFSNCVDEIDLQILTLLAKDCRLGYAEIARDVHLSRMAVRNRVLRMVDEGIIERFTVQLNARKVGIGSSAFLQVRTKTSKMEKVAMELAKNPKIESVYATTGNSGLHVHAFIENSNELEKFVYDYVYHIDGVEEVNFTLMLRRFKSTRLFV